MSRQNFLSHGKTFSPTAKLFSHGKTFSLTAKLSFARQNFSLTAKLFLSRQNFFSHGKTFFLAAKLLSHGKTVSLTAKLSHGKTSFLTAKIWSQTATKFFGSSHRYNRVSGSRMALVYRIHHSATLHWGPDSSTPFFSNDNQRSVRR